MAIVSIKDMLDRAADFEKRLERYYSEIRDRSTNDGVRLLTYYLSRHRRHLEQALANYSAADLEHIYHVQLKYDIDYHPEQTFHMMKTVPELAKGADLLEAASEYDMELVGFYRKILEQPLSSEAAALIESLIRVEEKDIVMLKKMVAMDYF